MTADEQQIEQITLDNGLIRAVILTYGGVIQRLETADADGAVRDVVLGFSDAGDYIDQEYYIGTVIGRCANRIGGASFALNGKVYALEANEGNNHLHGGSRGFWNVPFSVRTVGKDFVTLRRTSPDGEGGYPGNLEVDITYTLIGKALEITYTAVSDRDTVVNLTHHSYFNLEKDHTGNILQEQLTVFADHFTEIDAACSSTGRICTVENTPFDLRTPALIGERVNAAHEQMQKGSGLNHNYVLSKPEKAFGRVAEVKSSDGKLTLCVESTMPGVQVYTGNYLDGSLTGKNGEAYQPFSGICLETQYYPDAIHFPAFPSPVLKAGELYHEITRFRFL